MYNLFNSGKETITFRAISHKYIMQILRSVLKPRDEYLLHTILTTTLTCPSLALLCNMLYI